MPQLKFAPQPYSGIRTVLASEMGKCDIFG